MQLPSKEIWIPIVTGVSSFLIGVGAGYGIFRYRGKRPASAGNGADGRTEGSASESDSLEAEIGKEEEGRDTQPQLPFGSAEEIREARRFSEGRSEERIVKVIPNPDYVEHVNAFSQLPEDDPDDDWDYQREEELYRQNPNRPYVISIEEYQADAEEWDQESLTYYEGDMILIHDNSMGPIYDQEGTIGPLMFGHGSKDKNIFFVRNCKLNAEYEVKRDPGHYEHEVLGIENIEHSRKRTKKPKKPIPKFKMD